jgi:hypothetical protein
LRLTSDFAYKMWMHVIITTICIAMLVKSTHYFSVCWGSRV